MSKRKLSEEVRELREEIKRLREAVESRPYWPTGPIVIPGPGSGYQPFPQFVPPYQPWPFDDDRTICDDRAILKS